MGMKNPFGDIVKTAHGVSIACLVYEEHTRNWDAQRKIQNHDWGTIFADVAASHNQARPRCTACKKISKATVKALWYQHALAVIPGSDCVAESELRNEPIEFPPLDETLRNLNRH